MATPRTPPAAVRRMLQKLGADIHDARRRRRLTISVATRLGALRLRRPGDDVFQAPRRGGVPALVDLGRLLQITKRILRDEESDEDLQDIFAPGSSLGGARPKVSVNLNPVPTDLKSRALTTNIDLNDGTCSVDLLESACEYFAPTLAQARVIIRSVASATSTWRHTAETVGARSAEITRMSSAFEHEDLSRALSR